MTQEFVLTFLKFYLTVGMIMLLLSIYVEGAKMAKVGTGYLAITFVVYIWVYPLAIWTAYRKNNAKRK